jgi:acyl-CoA reductase-like NAD-dependent aldehyde dehydrogenase
MGITQIPFVIAGKIFHPATSELLVSSLDGSVRVPAAETTSSQLRTALRFADQSQERLNQTSLQERIQAVKLLMKEYSKRRNDVAQGLALFRGLVIQDSLWMCDVLDLWAEEVEDLIRIALGSENINSIISIESKFQKYGQLEWVSKGKAALFCSSTMDGPAAIAAICHGMLSGTHVILRPSWRDAVTHIAYEILIEHGLEYYGQLVRWRSDAPSANLLNKQILMNASQGLIFSSNETYQQLIQAIAPLGSNEWESLSRKIRRYGTGLPLAIVTESADLERAADQVIEGARLGSGKFCLSTSPVLVCDGIYQKFKNILLQKVEKLQSGSSLSDKTDLGEIDPSEIPALNRALESFGGKIEHGQMKSHMELVVLTDVPSTSSCLYEEFPGTLLCLIPVESLDQAIQLGKESLRFNYREAWTAVVTYGNSQEFKKVYKSLDSYRHCHGGIVAQVKLLLPHQGSYFLLDFMRRVTLEISSQKQDSYAIQLGA